MSSTYTNVDRSVTVCVREEAAATDNLGALAQTLCSLTAVATFSRARSLKGPTRRDVASQSRSQSLLTFFNAEAEADNTREHLALALLPKPLPSRCRCRCQKPMLALS